MLERQIYVFAFAEIIQNLTNTEKNNDIFGVVGHADQNTKQPFTTR